MKTKFLKILSVFMWIFFSTTGISYAAYTTGLNADDLAVEMEQPEHMRMDFQTYQRNLDDLYYISLTTNPDPKYGINTVIIDLSRKLAENPEDVETLISLGHIYRILGQPHEANRFYKKALKLKPNDYYIYVFSSMMYFQTQNLPEAMKQIDAAIKVNPFDIHAWLARGRLARKLSDMGEAVTSYEEALKLNPDNEEAIFMLSAHLMSQNKQTEALELFERLHAKHPKNRLVRYQLGSLYLANRQIKRTINLWEDLFLDGHRDPQFMLSLAVAYYENEEYERAEKILEHLEFFFPREESVQFLLGELYRATDRLDEAERTYRLLVGEFPGYMDAYVGLVLTLLQQKNLDEAKQVLGEAAARFNDKENLSQLKNLIDQGVKEGIDKASKPVSDADRTA